MGLYDSFYPATGGQAGRGPRTRCARQRRGRFSVRRFDWLQLQREHEPRRGSRRRRPPRMTMTAATRVPTGNLRPTISLGSSPALVLPPRRRNQRARARRVRSHKRLAPVPHRTVSTRGRLRCSSNRGRQPGVGSSVRPRHRSATRTATTGCLQHRDREPAGARGLECSAPGVFGHRRPANDDGRLRQHRPSERTRTADSRFTSRTSTRSSTTRRAASRPKRALINSEA